MPARFTVESRETQDGSGYEYAVVRDGNVSNPETDWRGDPDEIAGLLPGIRAQHVLREAFAQITANMANWKDRIAEEIHADMVPLAEAAIPFMTGSVPTFEKLPSGNYLVRAAGYYEAIGA